MMFLALLAAAPVAVFQPTPVLDQLVAQFTGRPAGMPGGARTAVDPRLRLAACNAPQLDWYTPVHDAVVVRCMIPAWRIFVAVDALPQAAPVAAAPAVAAAPIHLAPVIKRGDPVTVEAVADGFSIARDGIAMGDAPPGGRLLVKVDEKQPPIQAIALEAGRATLPGFAE